MRNVAKGPSRRESRNQFIRLRPLDSARPALINANVPHPRAGPDADDTAESAAKINTH